MKHYDVFLSHANADKNDYVEELKKSFDKLGISVFYDKDSIEWGDNWKQKIYTGLENCNFGVIVISEHFFGREWTEKELQVLLSRQKENGQKLILPILHNITVQKFYNRYKNISDIQFLSDKTCDIKDITIQLARILLSSCINAQKADTDTNSKYEIIKDYCENKMCSSLDFFDWVTRLMGSNDFIEPYDDNEWIGWDICEFRGKNFPLFQQKDGLYRINPQYYDDFKVYFEKEIRPQM